MKRHFIKIVSCKHNVICFLSFFGSHLLDLLHEQEKSISINSEANNSNLKYKDDREINDISSTSEEGASIKRWTTEEDLSGSIVLERKTQSLADFTQGNLFYKVYFTIKNIIVNRFYIKFVSL